MTMKNTILYSAAIGALAFSASGAFANPDIQTKTNLIYNKDTGAKVDLNSNDIVVGQRNADPSENGYDRAMAAEKAKMSEEAAENYTKS